MGFRPWDRRTNGAGTAIRRELRLDEEFDCSAWEIAVHVPSGALVEVSRKGDGGRRTRSSVIPGQPAEGSTESAEASGSEAVVNRMNRSAGGDSGRPRCVKNP